MIARLLITCIALLALFAAPGASAHTLDTAKPGSAEYDLGRLEDLPAGGRLLHATLVDEGDELRIRFADSRETGTSLVQLLVPVGGAEDDAGAEQLPRLSLDAPEDRFDVAAEKTLVDDMTGIEYRLIEQVDISSGSDIDRLTVLRGGAPSRVALRVAQGDVDTFLTNDPNSTPRSVAAARNWYLTPAVPPKRQPVDDSARLSRYVVIPGGIALVMLATLVWWIRRGRARARIRGLERSS